MPTARNPPPSKSAPVSRQSPDAGSLARMIGPIPLPDWLPWWMAVAILVPAVLFLLAFVLMPFNVFGVKSRLDVIEARLDEIQGEIRALSLRLPEQPDENQAPIPPRRPPARAEPRLDWPR